MAQSVPCEKERQEAAKKISAYAKTLKDTSQRQLYEMLATDLASRSLVGTLVEIYSKAVQTFQEQADEAVDEKKSFFIILNYYNIIAFYDTAMGYLLRFLGE